MSIQSKRVDFTEAEFIAHIAKRTRGEHKAAMASIKCQLVYAVKDAIYKDRTDTVLSVEVKEGLRKAFKEAGFSTSVKELERYL